MKSIVVVDDQKIIRVILEALLKNCGYKLFFIEDAKEAVNMIIREHPDLVLMDYYMPGLNGLEAVKIVRDNGYKGIILASTASEKIQIDLESGLWNGCLLKPFEKDFLHTIKMYLGDEDE